MSTSWERFSTTLAVGVENARVPADRSHDLATAIDLYLASFYEISIRARLLTLMTCLEVLAPVTERHTTAIRALSTFKSQLETQLAQANGTEERDALEALAREIDFKKETSIRRRLRALILSEAPLDGDAKTALAKKVVDAYDLRGGIVHTGLVASQALHRAHETTLEAVKLLLRARLSIARNGPMSPR